jgi:hypothetical protein
MLYYLIEHSKSEETQRSRETVHLPELAAPNPLFLETEAMRHSLLSFDLGYSCKFMTPFSGFGHS